MGLLRLPVLETGLKKTAWTVVVCVVVSCLFYGTYQSSAYSDDEVAKEEDIFTSPLEKAQQDAEEQERYNATYPVPPPVYAQPRMQTQGQAYAQPVEPKRGLLSRLFGWGKKKVMTHAKLPIEQIPKNQPEKIKDPPPSLNPIVRVPETLFFGETELAPGFYAMVLQSETPMIQLVRENNVMLEVPAKATTPSAVNANNGVTAKPAWKPQSISGNLGSTPKAVSDKQQQLAQQSAQQVAIAEQAKQQESVIKPDMAQVEYLGNSNQAILVYTRFGNGSSGEVWKSAPVVVLH